MNAHRILALFLVAGSVLVAAGPATQAGTSVNGTSFETAAFRTDGGVVRDAYGVLGVASGATPEARAVSFLAGNAARFHLDGGDVSELVVSSVHRSLAADHVRFQQVWDGVPVVGGDVSVHMARGGTTGAPDGTVLAVHTRAVTAVPAQAASIPSGAAVAAALSSGRGDVQSVREVVLASGTTGITAWEVRFHEALPLSMWTVFVDAATGEVLRAEDSVLSATGQVWVNPMVASGDATLRDNQAGWDQGVLPTGHGGSRDFTSYYQTANLTGVTAGPGGAILEGPYVKIMDATASGDSMAYPKEDPRFEEVMAYYWMDWSARNIHDLGFNTTMDFQIPVWLHDQPAVFNAFYAGPGTGAPTDPTAVGDNHGQGIHFGWHAPAGAIVGSSAGIRGFADAAEDAEVIIHEYGHAVLDNAVPGFPGGSMHEGWADYWAASQLSRVSGGHFDACIAEWFTHYLGMPANATQPACLRNLENDLGFYYGQPSNHYWGQVWSGALWDLRNELGPLEMERFALEAIHYLPVEGSFHAGAEALLIADSQLYGSAHSRLIVEEFASRNVTNLVVTPELLDGIQAAQERSRVEAEGAAAAAPGPEIALLVAGAALAAMVARRRK